MALIATLVVGSNGATSLHGKSSPLSTPSDRARFLARHRSAAAFIIGKQSAFIESYDASQVPIFVFSRSNEPLSLPNPLMKQLSVKGSELGEISRNIDQRIAGDIVVEAGASLLAAMIAAGVIDVLEISISPIAGDGHFIDLAEILRDFDCSEVAAEDGTRLLQCRYQGNSANG